MAAKSGNRGRRIPLPRRGAARWARTAPRRRAPLSLEIERQIASALVEGRRIRLRIAARIERAFRAHPPASL